MKAVVITGRNADQGRPWNHPERVKRRAIRGPILAHVRRSLSFHLPGHDQGIGAIYPGYLFTFPDGQVLIEKDGTIYGHVLPNYVHLASTYNPPVPVLKLDRDFLQSVGVPVYNTEFQNAIFHDLTDASVSIPPGYTVLHYADLVAAGYVAQEEQATELNAGYYAAQIEAAKSKIWRYSESDLVSPVYAVRFVGIDWFLTVPWYFPSFLEDDFQLPYTGLRGLILAPAELVDVRGPNSQFAPGNYVPRLWSELLETEWTVLQAQMSADYQAHRAEQLARMNELGAGAEVPSYAFAPKAFFRDAGKYVKVHGQGANPAAVVQSLTRTGRAPRMATNPKALFVPAMTAKKVEGVTDAMVQAAHDAILAEVLSAQQADGVPTDVDISDGGNVGRNPTGPGRNPTAPDETRIGYADPAPDASWNVDDILSAASSTSGSFGEHGGGGGVTTDQVLGFAAQIMAWYEQGQAGAVDPENMPAQLTEGQQVMGIMEAVSDFKAGDYIGGACAAIAVAGSALQSAKIVDRRFPWKAFASSVASGAAAGAAVGVNFVGIGAAIGAVIGAIVGAIACVVGWLCGRNPRGTIGGIPYEKGVPAWAKTYAPQAFIDWLEDMDMKGVFQRGVEECQQAMLGWSVDEIGHVLPPEQWAGAFDPFAWEGQRWAVAYPYPRGAHGNHDGTISDEDADQIRTRSFPDYNRCPWVYQAYRALGINYEESLKAYRATGERGFVYIDQKVMVNGQDAGFFGGPGLGNAGTAIGAGLVVAGLVMASKGR